MTLNIIGGKFRGKKLTPLPVDTKVRPTSNLLRGAVFDIVRGYLPGARFLDLFAGSGAVGFEAISQGVQQAVLVEKDSQVFKTLEKNFSYFKSESVQIHQQDSMEFCRISAESKEEFNIIFLDPPFENDFSPYLAEVLPILSEKGVLLIQFPTKRPPSWISEAYKVKKYGESSLAIFYN